ncbi:MAG: hypothetical protein H7243_08185 [Sphingomonadaceae bacterium]|nr:hypothetical protein [Sphingomonadaceae bacterium]
MYRALRDGGVETVDTITAGTRIVDLTPLLHIAPVHGVTGAIFDGCLLNQVVDRRPKRDPARSSRK